MSRTLSIERVAAIKAEVASAVAREHDGAQLTVTDEPVALDDESVVERALLIANRRRVPIHHVTVQTLGRQTSISFDAEIDGALPLGVAHEIVTGLEGAIGDELGAGFEVESHIEPLEVLERAGRDSDEDDRLRVEHVLRRNAPADRRAHGHPSCAGEAYVRRLDRQLSLHCGSDAQRRSGPCRCGRSRSQCAGGLRRRRPYRGSRRTIALARRTLGAQRTRLVL